MPGQCSVEGRVCVRECAWIISERTLSVSSFVISKAVQQCRNRNADGPADGDADRRCRSARCAARDRGADCDLTRQSVSASLDSPRVL
eukprot:6443458-Prymnesium_polylepis.1